MTGQPSFQLRERGRSNAALTRLDRELVLPAYDLLLVGDGSGEAKWTGRIGLGWACVAIERAPNLRTLTQGNWNIGSIEFAELMAYFQALVTFEQTRGEIVRDVLRRRIEVLVLTDNDVICKQAPEGLAGRAHTKATGPLWAGLAQLRHRGYGIQFKLIPRLSLKLNCLCDDLAGKARKASDEAVSGMTNSPDLRTLNPVK